MGSRVQALALPGESLFLKLTEDDRAPVDDQALTANYWMDVGLAELPAMMATSPPPLATLPALGHGG